MFDIESSHKKESKHQDTTIYQKQNYFYRASYSPVYFLINLSLYRRVEKWREKSSSVLDRWKRARGYYNAVES